MIKKVLLACMAAATLAGCATQQAQSPSLLAKAEVESPLIARSNDAADLLAQALGQSAIATGTPVVVASLASVDNLTRSSTFGRAVGEQIAARLASRGVPVVELKLRNSVFMSKDGGEFMLSREVKDLTQSYKTNIVVAGTYAEANSNVVVTLKAVDVTSNRVLTGFTYSVPKAEVTGMLAPRSQN